MLLKMPSIALLCVCLGLSASAFQTDEHFNWPMLWANLQSVQVGHHWWNMKLPGLIKHEGETTLLECLELVKLDKALEAKGPFTVFGPCNKAFQDLPPALFDTLKHNLTLLESVLKYHVCANQAVYSSELENDMLVPTLNGKKARVNIYGDEQKIITIDGCVISRPDLNASNGVLHEINSVLLPPVGDLVTTISGCPQKTELVEAVKKAGLVEILESPGPCTLFAPLDSAFAKIPAADLDALLNNKTALRNVLTYHVIPATCYSAGLTDGKYETMNGEHVKITISEKGVKVNDANVVMADIVATNGVAHAIDTVLMPKWMSFQDMMRQPSPHFRRWSRL